MDHGHHHQQQIHRQYSVGSASNINIGIAGSSSGDRQLIPPQWSIQETRDFLMIRAELDPTFMETKRNKLLWEVTATRMREKGYQRSAEQCKFKWKNLVTRYKGCETMETEVLRQQFPFYTEMQTIFTSRMLWLETEAATSDSKKMSLQLISASEEEDNEDWEKGVPRKKRKVVTTKGNASSLNPPPTTTTTTSNDRYNSFVIAINKMMEDYTKQQMHMETKWLKAYEEREEERRVKEMEWRQTMEALENERIMMDRRMREREEQRRVREEARAEKRDALITALLNKLSKS